jgi:hypothetical protein
VKRELSRHEDHSFFYLGVDDKNFKRNHFSVILLYNLDQSRILDVINSIKDSSSSFKTDPPDRLQSPPEKGGDKG